MEEELRMNKTRRSNKRRKLQHCGVPAFCLAFILTALLFSFSLAGAETPQELDFFDLINQTERRDGFFVMRNEKDGTLILRTARLLHPGDGFIDPDNDYYRVVRLEEDTAWAHLVESDARNPASIDVPALETAAVGQEDKRTIGIYHSHGAESYVPSDGTESIDEGGGIIRVGDTFAGNLEQRGVEVIHSRKTHVPHDAGAYNRSRRTAVELLNKQPDALFDVHRDAVPAEEYDAEVKGHDVVRILFVVGRQNQNMDSNQAFARSLKNIADERFPGLVKGILLADGSFNQDLAPRSLLLEVGAHENTREQAQESVTLFSDVVTGFLYGAASTPGQTAKTEEGGIAMRSALKLLVALAIAFFFYLLISAGNWEELKLKVTSFFQREFADLRHGFERRRKQSGGDEE